MSPLNTLRQSGAALRHSGKALRHPSAALGGAVSKLGHKVLPRSHHKEQQQAPQGRGMMLYVEDLTVSFDGFKALNNLTFYLCAGELRCFIGPNGAGKTTMMDVLTGKTRPDSGSAYFCSDPVHESADNMFNLLEMDEVDVVQAGIGRKFQKPSVIESLTVAQNLELAQEHNKGVFHALTAKLRPHEREFMEEILERIRLSSKRNVLAGILSHGQKQWLEIGMLLMQRPRLIMLDEPVAGMTPEEIEMTIDLLHDLEGKHTIMVIEHDMAFIRAISSLVTVLNAGSVLCEGTIDEVSSDPQVITAYLGSA